MKFDVLGTMRAIRDDEALTGTEAHLLMCAVLRTDNNSMKVRYSLELLAEDAKVSYRTVLRAFKEERVLRYFAKVERSTRRVDLWFANVCDMVSPTCDMVSQDDGHGVTPSTLSTLESTSNKATVPDGPVVPEGSEVRKGSPVDQPSLMLTDTDTSSNVDSRDAAQRKATEYMNRTVWAKEDAKQAAFAAVWDD